MALSTRASIYLSISHGPLDSCRSLTPKSNQRRRYEKKITDYNFESLIRTDATKEYSEMNTIFGPFFLIIAPTFLFCIY